MLLFISWDPEMLRFPRIFNYRLRSLLLFIAACALVTCAWTYWDLIPGTFHFDANGIPRGTGTTTYNYDNGKLAIKEWYRRGLIYRATWYRPNGTEIATEEYNKANGGVGYYLRQDGSIKSKYTYKYFPSERFYLAHGNAIFYRADGTVERIIRFSEGVEVEEQSAGLGVR